MSDRRIAIPDAFRREHYHHADVMLMLGVTDEATFWQWYLQGKILPGVHLTTLVGQPFVVWPREDIHEWIAADCPIDRNLAERQTRVLDSLVRAVRGSEAAAELQDAIRELVGSN